MALRLATPYVSDSSLPLRAGPKSDSIFPVVFGNPEEQDPVGVEPQDVVGGGRDDKATNPDNAMEEDVVPSLVNE